MQTKMIQQSFNKNSFKKRGCSKVWTNEENRCLLELCKKDMGIIENKGHNTDLSIIKKKVWGIIHREYIKLSGIKRSLGSLKDHWRQMKYWARIDVVRYYEKLALYGQSLADSYKPHPFAFELWNFIQKAHEVCKSKTMYRVDYSKVQLVLDGGVPNGVSLDDDNKDCPKVPQNMCELKSKDETSDSEDGPSNSKRLYSSNSYVTNVDYTQSLSINNVAATPDTSKILKRGHFVVESKDKTYSEDGPSNSKRFYSSNSYVTNVDYTQSLSINNVAATLDTSKILESGQFAAESKDKTYREDGPSNSKRLYSSNSFVNNVEDTQSLSINNVAATLDTSKILESGQFAAESKDKTYREDGPSNSKRLYSSNSFVNNVEDTQSLSINNVAATLDTSKILESGQFAANIPLANGNNHTLEMQIREHVIRMEILYMQLLTATCNRDVAEINKMTTLKNFELNHTKCTIGTISRK